MKHSWLPALAFSCWGLAVSALALGLLVLPQRLAQRPMARGVLSLQLQADGGLRLWNQPVTEGQVLLLARKAAARPGWQRLRLVPDPGTPRGRVLRLIDVLDDGGLPLELQLPAT